MSTRYVLVARRTDSGAISVHGNFLSFAKADAFRASILRTTWGGAAHRLGNLDLDVCELTAPTLKDVVR